MVHLMPINAVDLSHCSPCIIDAPSMFLGEMFQDSDAMMLVKNNIFWSDWYIFWKEISTVSTDLPRSF